MEPKQDKNSPPLPMMGMGGKGPGNMKGFGMQKPVKAKDVKGTVKRLFMYFKQEKYMLVLIALMTFLSAGVGLMAPFYIGKAIDTLELGIGNVDFQGLWICLGILGSVYVVDFVLSTFQGFMMAGISQRVVRTLRKDLFQKLQKLPVPYFDSKTHGELMSRLANDVDNISSTIGASLTQFIIGVLMIIGALVMMLLLSPLLTLSSVITLPLMFLLTRTITRKTKVLFREQQKILGQLNGSIEENISGFAVIKAFQNEKNVIESFSVLNEQLCKVSTKAQIWTGFLMPIMNVINNLGFAAVAFMGGYLAVKDMITVGLIASFLSYSRQFTRPLINLSNIYNALQTAIAGAERVFEIMDEQEETEDQMQSEKLSEDALSVTFQNVSFHYQPNQPVLQNMSFHVEAGRKIALVGPTGAGKTTIVNLISRFYDVCSGAILIDSKDIRTYKREDLRKSFGIVLQDTYLFSGTIKENIRYGKPDATDSEIIEAAKRSHAHGFIRKLPLKYDTVLIESGKNLSQGERQLLAITRALISQHKILILDEATSSIDTRTEKMIQEAMLHLMAGRTSFVIAHRLSTIKDADCIMVIREGMIAESGNHETLMSLKGHYYQMILSHQKEA